LLAAIRHSDGTSGFCKPVEFWLKIGDHNLFSVATSHPRMEVIMSRFVLCLAVCVLSVSATVYATKPKSGKAAEKPLELGNFSVSLTVKDIAKSREFYEKLGFHKKNDHGGKNWVVLQNETATIGLFQGMFEKNSLTFNPGWDRNSKTLPNFEDVRDLQNTLKKRGLTLTLSADESTDGPAFFTLMDPDGNPILVDQHVPKPKP
jgi:catechol 2,3-dioxygenase-like lactoylglutathione lyase family enzyme